MNNGDDRTAFSIMERDISMNIVGMLIIACLFLFLTSIALVKNLEEQNKEGQLRSRKEIVQEKLAVQLEEFRLYLLEDMNQRLEGLRNQSGYPRVRKKALEITTRIAKAKTWREVWNARNEFENHKHKMEIAEFELTWRVTPKNQSKWNKTWIKILFWSILALWISSLLFLGWLLWKKRSSKTPTKKEKVDIKSGKEITDFMTANSSKKDCVWWKLEVSDQKMKRFKVEPDGKIFEVNFIPSHLKGKVIISFKELITLTKYQK